jgi:hypothetical protein
MCTHEPMLDASTMAPFSMITWSPMLIGTGMFLLRASAARRLSHAPPRRRRRRRGRRAAR